MEFIRGRSLAQLLREQGPFGPREAALIGIDLCRALGAVHNAGVVHRDIKAENVMREEGGRILLADFGAGIDLNVVKGERERSISGTPLYMPSEILLGKAATQRSDIFSLGVLLYRLVTGKFPIEARTWDDLLAKHARREAKLLRDQRQDLPEGFIGAVERAMAWKPEDRFATVGQMEQALSLAIGTGSGAPATPEIRSSPAQKRSAWFRSPIVLSGIGILALIALLAGLRFNRQRAERESVTSVKDGATVQAPAEQATGTPTASYSVEAALYRVSGTSGLRERLESGAGLSLGDNLSFEFKASAPLYVYIINEDEAGHAYALFPIPGLDQENPLPANATHLLPGKREGKNLSWAVDSPGGREHLMVLASPERLVEFENEMKGLARPGEIAVALPERAMISLRGIGSLSESPIANQQRSAGRLFEMAHEMAATSEVVHGVWMRRIDLENPAP
jgi:serine/threonine protein kinase